MKRIILLSIAFMICFGGQAFAQEDDLTSLLTFETTGDHIVAVYEKIEEQWLFLIGAPVEGIEIANGMHEYRFGTESFWGKFTVEANGQPQTWRLNPGRPQGVANGVQILAASALSCVLGTLIVITPPQGFDFINYLVYIGYRILGVAAIGVGGVGCLVGLFWITMSLPSSYQVE